LPLLARRAGGAPRSFLRTSPTRRVVTHPPYLLVHVPMAVRTKADSRTERAADP